MALQLAKPLLAAMKDGKENEAAVADRIRNDVRCARDDEFACAGDATDPTEPWLGL
jgi:hypothetical protein